MHEIGAFEAKNTLGALLDRVEEGEEIRISRHGKPVARLVPDTPARDPAKALAALDEFTALAKKAKRGPFPSNGRNGKLTGTRDADKRCSR